MLEKNGLLTVRRADTGLSTSVTHKLDNQAVAKHQTSSGSNRLLSHFLGSLGQIFPPVMSPTNSDTNHVYGSNIESNLSIRKRPNLAASEK